MTYIGIKVRLAGHVTILDADRQGRICLRFGASTVTLSKAVRSLLDQGHNQILLNLERVNAIDDHDCRDLVSTWTRVKERGVQIKVVRLKRKLAELMTTAKWPLLFDVYDSETQGLHSFRSDSQLQEHGALSKTDQSDVPPFKVCARTRTAKKLGAKSQRIDSQLDEK